MQTEILLALSIFLGLTGPVTPIVNAASCGALAFNPVTGKLDCVGVSIPTNGTAGQCLQVTSASPFTVGWAVCGSTVTPTTNNLLLENSSFLLLEDGSKLTLEP